ncbi:hypothetical protein CYLTODRAFT_174368 [Cylindrobasidium torrendii FP15055 ss-10]|uniref:F-box domain-containing protein n=1 Tax=Cylindrobasidium torrendii FP15055 ss-10 TaxID=1314674 RepID=A0A0D7AXA6_9AGAR|nr:hypothetical protein CYLTODRAFT_174368 [Cylindrobasidium torrendii FP15055 ss-10]
MLARWCRIRDIRPFPHTTTDMHSLDIPVEICEAILDHVQSSNEIGGTGSEYFEHNSDRAIHACALVCRSWLRKSRSLEFRTFHLDGSNRRMLLAAQEILSHPSCSFLYDVRDFKITYPPSSNFGGHTHGLSWLLNQNILSAFPRVQKLEFISCDFTQLDDWQGFCTLPLFGPHLTHLVFGACCTIRLVGDIRDMVMRCSNLRTLDVDVESIEGDEDSALGQFSTLTTQPALLRVQLTSMRLDKIDFTNARDAAFMVSSQKTTLQSLSLSFSLLHVGMGDLETWVLCQYAFADSLELGPVLKHLHFDIPVLQRIDDLHWGPGVQMMTLPTAALCVGLVLDKVHIASLVYTIELLFNGWQDISMDSLPLDTLDWEAYGRILGRPRFQSLNQIMLAFEGGDWLDVDKWRAGPGKAIERRLGIKAPLLTQRRTSLCF